MRYLAIAVGVGLAGLSVAHAQNVVRPDVPPSVEHASLVPLEDLTDPAIPALPPDLPAALPNDGTPDAMPADIGGARDPFRPFTLDLQPKKAADAFLTPLQRYDLQQLKVVGVLLDLEPPRAMVQDDAGMGYIVTPGTLIGRRAGIVTDVQDRQIIVEETFVDFYGREQVRRAVLEMEPEESAKPMGRN